MKHVLLIYNPFAGKKKIKDYLYDIVNNIVDDNTELVIFPTHARGDAVSRVAGMKDSVDLVICSGGDGTLHEVVNGMMQREEEKRVPISYIPTGSTNDFGKSLNISSNMVTASSLARFGTKFKIDVASLNGKHFVYTACFGVFTETSYATSQDLKNILGHFAYIINGAGELTRVNKFEMKIEYDGQAIEGRFIFGAICSTTQVGGFKGIMGKDVKFNDGYFEMLLIKDAPLTALPSVILDVAQGKTEKYNDYIVHAKVKDVRIICNQPVPWCVDGEFGGEFKNATINVEQEAVTMMV